MTAARRGFAAAGLASLFSVALSYGCAEEDPVRPGAVVTTPSKPPGSADEMGGAGGESQEGLGGADTETPLDCEGDSCPVGVGEGTCADKEVPCAENSSCINLSGGYVCLCDEGFRFKDGACVDVDECEQDVCSTNATCTNAEPGYSCACSGALEGDGLYCSEEDSCAEMDCGDGTCVSGPEGGLCDCPLGTAGASCQDSCEVVSFSDEALSASIAVSLDQAGPTFEGTTLSETRLNLADPFGERIQSLEGMQCWGTLEALDLTGHEVSSLSPLARLARLSDLHLGCNPVLDLTPLSELYSLSSLSLDMVPCPSPTAGNLDLAPLSSLLQLDSLSVSGRQLDSLEPLTGLLSLRTLYAIESSASNWQPLGELASLRKLVLTGADITDFSFLPEMQQLEELNLGSTGFADVSKLSTLTHLRTLDLSSNGISVADLEDGSEIPLGVSSLDLSYNALTEIPDLTHLQQILFLSLWGNSLESLDGLANLKWIPGATLWVGSSEFECAAEGATFMALKKRGVHVVTDCF